MTNDLSLRPQSAPGSTEAPPGSGWSGEEREKAVIALAALAELQDDWDGYGAARIDPAAVRFAQLLIDQLISGGANAPSVLPVPDGGVQLEWSAGPVELEFEIEPGGQSAVFVCDDAVGSQRIDGELPGDEQLLSLAFARFIAYRQP